MNRGVKMKYVASTAFLLLVGTTVTSAITPGQAEEQGLFTRIGLSLGLSKQVETPETRLSGELTTCLQLAVGDADGPSIGFTVDLDEDGAVLDTPALLVSAASEVTSQTQLDRAAIAIENCLPLHLDGQPLRKTRLTLALDRGKIAYLERETLLDAPAPLDPEFAELALDLDRDTTRDVQKRLTVAGFDTGKPDGVIGPNTRRAIAEWQIARDLAETGYLNHEQLGMIRDETQEALDKATAKPKKRRLSRYIRTADGCVRVRKTKRIVPGQSFKCDAKGLIESF